MGGWVNNARPQPLYPPPQRPGTHCIGDWVGARAGLDGCGKSRSPQGFDPRTVQTMKKPYLKAPGDTLPLTKVWFSFKRKGS